MSDEPVGTINIESNFIENCEAQESEQDSQEEDLKDLERQYAKKVAAVVGKA
jgi:hypothetical protein